jgi:hypothetical protein
MRNVLVGLLIVACLFESRGQTTVTFENNVFKVNGNPFFPMGWYECNTTRDLVEIHDAGANTVLVLWDFLVQAHRGKHTPAGYLVALQRFMQAADSLQMKVIVQIPYMKAFSKHTRANAITDSSYINTLVPQLKNKSALLGWYLGDEPEIHIQTQPYARLQRWYQLIKKLDPRHPVFVCIANGYVLENKTVRPAGARDADNPFPMKPFFDVLMQDHYALFVGDEVPSKHLAEFDEWLLSLYDCFEVYGRSGLPASSTMVVVQGYGGGVERMRTPVVSEIKYQVFSSLFYAQNDGHPNPLSKNAGGVLFWRFGASDAECRRNISDFMKFFRGNNLDVVLRQPNINTLVSSSMGTPKFESFLRYYDGAYYLFAINRTASVLDPEIALNIGRISSCTEVTKSSGAGEDVSLATLGQDKYKIVQVFRPREAKVYKIR